MGIHDKSSAFVGICSMFSKEWHLEPREANYMIKLGYLWLGPWYCCWTILGPWLKFSHTSDLTFQASIMFFDLYNANFVKLQLMINVWFHGSETLEWQTSHQTVCTHFAGHFVFASFSEYFHSLCSLFNPNKQCTHIYINHGNKYLCAGGSFRSAYAIKIWVHGHSVSKGHF